MRYAIYFTPGPDHPLTAKATEWLGRDPCRDQSVPPPEHLASHHPWLGDCTAVAAKYGFHATLKAPFRLKPGTDEGQLRDAAAAIAAETPSAPIAALALCWIGPFLALVPERTEPGIAALETALVHAFEPFRAPLNAAETEKRQPAKLTPRQQTLLNRWGYPYVLDQFRFHMTLSGPIPTDDRPKLEKHARHHFADHIGQPLTVDQIVIFAEEKDGAPFIVQHVFKLTGLRPIKGSTSNQ